MILSDYIETELAAAHRPDLLELAAHSPLASPARHTEKQIGAPNPGASRYAGVESAATLPLAVGGRRQALRPRAPGLVSLSGCCLVLRLFGDFDQGG
jgi:hypothetical protein